MTKEEVKELIAEAIKEERQRIFDAIQFIDEEEASEKYRCTYAEFELVNATLDKVRNGFAK